MENKSLQNCAGAFFEKNVKVICLISSRLLLPGWLVAGLVIVWSVKAESERYLTVDNRNIASASDVELVVGKVTKSDHNPLFGETEPWEQVFFFDNFYGNIVFDEDSLLYRLWWSSLYGPLMDENIVEYACSRDGIKWEKPNLGLVEYEGNKNNNIIMQNGHGHGVYRDLHETDPEKRYKMIAQYPGEGSISTAFSRNGFLWSDFVPAFDARGDSHNNVIWAPTLNKYVAISREWENRCRIVLRSESDDFETWSDEDIVIGCDSLQQVYTCVIFCYANMYFGLTTILDISSKFTWVELAWSPNTRNWTRIQPGTPFIPNGTEGSPDYGKVYECSAPLFMDSDTVRIYYAGGDGPHGEYGEFINTYLMFATMKKDRWAGLKARAATGTIVTEPFTCTGTDLYLCADVDSGGSITTEVVGENGLVLSENNPIIADVTDGKVTWGGNNIASLIGTPITLKFNLTNATLYSYFTAGARVPPSCMPNNKFHCVTCTSGAGFLS